MSLITKVRVANTSRTVEAEVVPSSLDSLSAEPVRRSVELAFLRRLTEAARGAGAAVLRRADHASDSVDAGLKRMQSPAFQQAARAMEQSIPEETSFGRFRDRP